MFPGNTIHLNGVVQIARPGEEIGVPVSQSLRIVIPLADNS